MNSFYTVCALLCVCIASTLCDDPPPPPQDGCVSIAHKDPCNGNNVKFQLHTHRGSEAVQVTDHWNNIKTSKYNPQKQNIFILHGFRNNMSSSSIVDIKNAYLKAGDYNVWTPDYSGLVRNPCYPFAVYNVPHIGRCISNLVKGLRVISPDPYIHIVGFSLGAHIAGRIGYEVRDKKIQRITGLDPAWPLFFSEGLGKRLSPNDAQFVDVIHSNMYMQGHPSNLGHVDFYPNGGSEQPGCSSGVVDTAKCNHRRAPILFAESINSPKGFWGMKCKDSKQAVSQKCPKQGPYEKMGHGVSLSARGLYYVKTAKTSPYALGQP